MEAGLGLKSGQTLNAPEKQEYLQEIAQLMQEQDIRVSDVQHKYGISWPTAREWYNMAAMWIAKQDNGLTRDGERLIHKGQIDRRLAELTRSLDKATDLDAKLKIHDRIIKYLDARARITGLNSEQVNVTTQQIKPLQIIRAEATGTEGAIVPVTVTEPNVAQ